MVRNYMRKGNHLKWSEDDMSRAISSVLRGDLGIRAAAGNFNIPVTTLQNRVASSRLNQMDRLQENELHFHKSVGHPTVFSEGEEKDIAERLKDLANRGFGCTPLQVRKAAFVYAERRNISNPWGTSKQAGADWFAGFMKRNPDISLRKPEGLSKARASGLTKEAVEGFYHIYSRVATDLNLQNNPQLIYNVDESGFPLNNNPSKIIAEKGKREVIKITNVERGENVTVVVCCSASGMFMPPFVIFKGKRFKDVYRKDLPPGTSVEMTESGYINEEVFLLWLHHFQKNRVQGRCILILDGHVSHCSLQCLEFCRENGIELLCLPPHTTHAIQPLDRAVFKPMKTFYHQAATNYMHNHPDGSITKFVFGHIFTEAWLRSATPAYATKGFECTGIFPYNPNAIPEDRYLPSLHFIGEPSQQGSTCEAGSSGPITQSLSVPASPETPTASTHTMSPCRKHVSPFADVIPTPEKCQTRKQTRTKLGPRHLTSDEGFNEAIEKKKKKFSREKSAPIANVMSARQRQKNIMKKVLSTSDEESSSDTDEDEENVPCDFCGLKYFSKQSASKGDWIRCQKCKKWFHEICVGAAGKKQFICGKCI